MIVAIWSDGSDGKTILQLLMYAMRKTELWVYSFTDDSAGVVQRRIR